MIPHRSGLSVPDFSDSLASAIWLAGRGWAVHPLDHPNLDTCAGLHNITTPCDGKRGKHPCTPFSRTATSDVQKVADWYIDKPTRNIGIACGPSGLLVVDEDVPGGFARYAESIGESEPHTFTVTTGRGRHFYFVAPPGGLGNVSGLLTPYGLDVRGTRGYVVGPGSVHKSGALYEPIDPAADVAMCPAWLIEALTAKRLGTLHQGVAFAEPVPEGQRHSTAVSFAGYLRKHDVNYTAAGLAMRGWHAEKVQGGETFAVEEALATLDDVYRRYPAGSEPLGEAPDHLRAVPGGSFVLDIPDVTPAVWGTGSAVLWACGEPAMIAAGPGAGKTTIASQLVRARIGLADNVLGLPVQTGERRVLYLAMDRPAQIARVLHRLFAPADRALLDDRLVIWRGPPPYDLGTHPDVLREMCERYDADTVVVDSLKDAFLGLSDDEKAAAWNRARQEAIEGAGVEVLELHHNVKHGAGGKPPTAITDVYGSTWLTSGCGSVIGLHGAPGDPIVEFRHLKPPADEVGPLKVMHDHDLGISTVWHKVDLLDLARHATYGITATDAAAALFGEKPPREASKQKARRLLDKLLDANVVTRSFNGQQYRYHSVPSQGADTP